jgi:hypothetical protein
VIKCSLCYWARLRDTSGELSSIIANNNIGGPTTVTIKSIDGAFQTSMRHLEQGEITIFGAAS